MRASSSRRAGLRVAARPQSPKPAPAAADADRIFGLDLADAPETMDVPEPPPWRLIRTPEEDDFSADMGGLGADDPDDPPDPERDEEEAQEDRGFPDPG